MLLRIKINGLDNAGDELRKAVAIGERNGLEKLGLIGAALLSSLSPVGATGNLAAGMTHEVQPSAVEIFASPPADVYSAPVDLGTRPHFPPSEALLLWVQRKLHINDEKQARSVAFLIARKISRTGTKGAQMFERAFPQLEQKAPDILELEIAKSVQAAGFGGK